MNSVRHPQEEPGRPQPEDLFRRELKPLDTYRIPDYATGALPVSPVGLASLAVAVIGLALSLFPWVGLFIGVPMDGCAMVLAAWSAWRIHLGRERGLAWCGAAAAAGLIGIALAFFMDYQEAAIAV
ncbi:MAG: hypothetical protein LBS27_04740 [Bifidobacteriaceae bacterium]|jgi:hypothetical protein|nr:hypothetical protein [Bifidobacteriaceae bacterium]